MAISSDNVKSVLLAGLGVAVVFTVWKIYNKAGQMKTDIVTAAGQIEKDLVQGITNMGNTVGNLADRVKANITGAVDTVASSVGIDTSGYQMPSQYGATELPFSKWSANTLATINALNRTRGISRTWKNAGDFVGWHVYSDGTIISPDGYYFSSKTNIAAAGSNDFTTDGNLAVNVDQVFSPFGTDFDQTRYQWQTAQEQA